MTPKEFLDEWEEMQDERAHKCLIRHLPNANGELGLDDVYSEARFYASEGQAILAFRKLLKGEQ